MGGASRRNLRLADLVHDGTEHLFAVAAENMCADACRIGFVEQPLEYDDLLHHARLQARLRTAICLDESIHSPEMASDAARRSFSVVSSPSVARARSSARPSTPQARLRETAPA